MAFKSYLKERVITRSVKLVLWRIGISKFFDNKCLPVKHNYLLNFMLTCALEVSGDF